MFFAGAVSSCSVDDETTENASGESNTKVYITDAPIDNPEVQAAYITVAEVRVNGQTVQNFQKTTIEISSLTNGKNKLLGDLNLQAGSTSNVVVVLSETDASGNTPGNYVLTANGEKHALVESSKEITVNDSAEILATGNNELVLDFDLRKSIVSSAEQGYRFAADTQLSNSIRVVNNQNAGVISGNVSNMENYNSEQMVVYAYKKGSFNSSEENADQRGIRFANAVNSSVVTSGDGNFSLHYMEEGDYELRFASYSDSDADGELEFEGQLEMATAGNLDLLGLTVQSNSTLAVEVLFTGLLNL